jgi:flagellar hook-length control protein FliK
MKSELNLSRLGTTASESSQSTGKSASGEKSIYGSNNAESDSTKKSSSSESSYSSGSSFKKVINDVAKSNRQAQKSKDPSHSSNSDDSPTTAVDKDNPASTDGSASLKQSIADDSEDQVSGANDKDSDLSNASQVVTEALSTIAQLLNLSSSQGNVTIQTNNLSDSSKEQLAEILYSLKGISSQLEEAVNNNQSVVINGATLDASQAASIDKLLRVETFHIEMALETAGVSADIADILAQKNNVSSANNGIVSATDPSQISMPASQIKQVMENIDSDTTDETVDTLFQKLAASLRDANTSSGNTAVGGNKLQDVQVVSTQETAQNSDTGGFDSKVMRTILKIDNTEAENQDAADGVVKLNLASSKTPVAENPAGSAQNSDNSSAVSLVDSGNSNNQNNMFSVLSDIKTTTTGKLVEDSVMNQVTDKLQSAVKNGVNEIRLLLKPESLGEMRVKLTVDGDVVMGKIYVESQQVKHILESNMQTLKDSFAQHNLQVGTFEVNVGGDSWKQMTDMQNPDSGFVNAGNKEVENAQADNIPDVANGMDTGRRFGSNTFEFFA